jgi:Xaa-Pro aminopeptidase
MPLADVVHESLLDAVANGDGERDLAALAKVSMRRAGAESSAGKPITRERLESRSAGGEQRA